LAATTSLSRANLNTLLTATIPVYLKGLFEQHFHNANVLLAYVNSRGNVKTDKKSGESILVDLAIGENETVIISSGYAQSTPAKQETMTQAEFPWTAIQGNVTLWKKDIAKNTGEGRVQSIVEAAVKQTMNTVKKKINADLVARGTGAINAGANPPVDVILGLKDLVGCGATAAKAPGANTGWGPASYGGVVQTDFTDWQSQVFNSTGADNLVKDLGTTLNYVTGGESELPDLILTSQTGFELYEATIAGKQQVTQTKVGDAGFQSLEFRGVPMHFDPVLTLGAAGDVANLAGAADALNSNRYYFLDARYLHWTWHSELNLDNPLSEWITPEDYPRQVRQLLLLCQFYCSARHKQGLLRSVLAPD
jgi:hypothetical protein